MIKALIAFVLLVLVAVVVGVTLIVLDARDREPVEPRDRPSVGRTAP